MLAKLTAQVPVGLRREMVVEALRSGMTVSAYCRHLLVLAQESRRELELLAKKKRSVRNAEAAEPAVCCDDDFPSDECCSGAGAVEDLDDSIPDDGEVCDRDRKCYFCEKGGPHGVFA